MDLTEVLQISKIADNQRLLDLFPPEDLTELFLHHEFYRLFSWVELSFEKTTAGNVLFRRLGLLTLTFFRWLEYLHDENKLAMFLLKNGVDHLTRNCSQNAKEGFNKIMRELKESLLMEKKVNLETFLKTWAERQDVRTTLSQVLKEHLLEFFDIALKKNIFLQHANMPIKNYVDKYKTTIILMQEYYDHTKSSVTPMNPTEFELLIVELLSNMFNSKFRITNPLYRHRDSPNSPITLDFKPSTLLASYSPFYCSAKNDREFSLLYSSSSWVILYDSNPYHKHRLTISDMISSTLCNICSEQIDTKSLFMSTNCKLRHKFHKECIRSWLFTEFTQTYDGIKTFINGLSNIEDISAVCQGCAMPFSREDLKAIFGASFTDVYKEILAREQEQFADLTKSVCWFQKQAATRKPIAQIKAALSSASPFVRDTVIENGKKIFKTNICSFCQGQNAREHSIEWCKLIEIFSSKMDSGFQKYCAACSKIIASNDYSMYLSCRHVICANCSVDWVCFCDNGFPVFQQYCSGKKVETLFPICPCYICGSLEEINGIMIHRGHFISFQHFIRRALFSIDKTIKCVHQNCKEVVPEYYLPMWNTVYSGIMTRCLEKANSLMASVKLPHEILQTQKQDPLLSCFLRQFYGTISENGPSLFCYKNTIKFAEEALTTKLPDTLNLLNEAKAYANSFPILPQQIQIKFNTMERLGKIVKIEELKFLAKECLHSMFFFSRLNNYFLPKDPPLYFMSIGDFEKPENIPNMRAEELDNLMIQGAFGYGFYLSDNINAIQAISKFRNGEYVIIAVHLAIPRDKPSSDEYPVNPKRVMVEQRIMKEREPKKVNKRLVRGTATGCLLNCEIVNRAARDKSRTMKYVVSFDPNVIVPLSMVTFTMDEGISN